MQAGVEAVWVPGTEALLAFSPAHVDPYLRAESGRDSPLKSPPRAPELFRELETQLPPRGRTRSSTASPQSATSADQFDLQRRLHRWLHFWLIVHVPLSARGTGGLMFAHVFLALKYM